jgi:signal peptidase II
MLMGFLSEKARLLTFVGGGVIILDQGTKWAVQKYLALHQSLVIIPGLFQLTYVENTGAAFGLLAEAPEGFRVAFLIGISLAALGVLGRIFYTVPQGRWSVLIPLAFVMGGATGNLIDRVTVQKVVDFLDFFWKDHHWYFFNVADSSITVGAISLMAVSLFSHQGDIFSKEKTPCKE